MISLGLFPFPTKNGVFPQHSPHLDSLMYSSPRPSCPATSEFGPSPAIRLSWHAITSNDKHVAPSQHVYLSHIPGRHLTSATPPVATPAGLSGEPPHTSGPKCTCSRNRLFVQNKKNDIFGICEIVKSIIIKISGDFNSRRNILKNPSCMCRNELRCQTPPLSKKSGSSCRCGVDWTRPKNDGLPKAFSRLSSPFRLSG